MKWGQNERIEVATRRLDMFFTGTKEHSGRPGFWTTG